MCGRFALGRAPSLIAELFNLADIPEILQPRFNVAPSTFIPIVEHEPDEEGNKLLLARWGFVPRWAKELPKIRPINAKGEAVRKGPMFRASFKDRRCLIPADGFYEWQKPHKKPFYIHPASGDLAAFAGVWDIWQEDKQSNEKLLTCSIITVAANGMMKPFHDRMPAVMLPENFSAWLTGSPEEAERLLKPVDDEYFAAVPVGKYVNKVGNEGPECIRPEKGEADLFGEES